mmetsp:Transcript_41345/g.89383  ORF Transcript_41345/g.89383 Transcript_41345/m.89383 type:complete len:241 (+) Transcript_41345:498-1220(+)
MRKEERQLDFLWTKCRRGRLMIMWSCQASRYHVTSRTSTTKTISALAPALAPALAGMAARRSILTIRMGTSTMEDWRPHRATQRLLECLRAPRRPGRSPITPWCLVQIRTLEITHEKPKNFSSEGIRALHRLGLLLANCGQSPFQGFPPTPPCTRVRRSCPPTRTAVPRLPTPAPGGRPLRESLQGGLGTKTHGTGSSSSSSSKPKCNSKCSSHNDSSNKGSHKEGINLSLTIGNPRRSS